MSRLWSELLTLWREFESRVEPGAAAWSTLAGFLAGSVLCAVLVGVAAWYLAR